MKNVILVCALGLGLCFPSISDAHGFRVYGQPVRNVVRSVGHTVVCHQPVRSVVRGVVHAQPARRVWNVLRPARRVGAFLRGR